jgi:uncharacterized membrane protein
MMMKIAIAVVMSLSVMVALACESPTGGGVSAGEGFTIVTPASATQVKQGETQIVAVSLNRGQNFKRDVTLEIKATKGINVEPTKALVKGSDKPDVQLRITVAKDANIGEYKIYVKGTPETGEATTTELTVKVVSPK